MLSCLLKYLYMNAKSFVVMAIVLLLVLATAGPANAWGYTYAWLPWHVAVDIKLLCPPSNECAVIMGTELRQIGVEFKVSE